MLGVHPNHQHAQPTAARVTRPHHLYCPPTPISFPQAPGPVGCNTAASGGVGAHTASLGCFELGRRRTAVGCVRGSSCAAAASRRLQHPCAPVGLGYKHRDDVCSSRVNEQQQHGVSSDHKRYATLCVASADLVLTLDSGNDSPTARTYGSACFTIASWPEEPWTASSSGRHNERRHQDTQLYERASSR